MHDEEYHKLNDENKEPPYVRACDQNLKQSIEKMWKIVAKLKTAPIHHETQPIKNGDDLLTNMFDVKT